MFCSVPLQNNSAMRSFILLIGAVLTLIFNACSPSDKGPDVSNIPVTVTINRFDQAFFALDTTQPAKSLAQLQSRYPGFYADYMNYIIGVNGNPADTSTLTATTSFISAYRSIYDSLQPLFANTSELEQELKKAYQHLAYYFPSYNPGNIWFFIGPFDAPGVAMVKDGVAIGLQQFAGQNFFAYQTPAIQNLYPNYLSRRFAPSYIVPNVIKAIGEDLFPDKSAERPLIEQMIEKGKYWYLAKLLLPATSDSLLTGFTQTQLEWCNENEGQIWSHLIRTEELQTLNPVLIQNYIGEAPFTQGLSQEYSPGNIGQWIGWRIVKTFAEKNSNLSPTAIMNTPAAEILEKAKYKPK